MKDNERIKAIEYCSSHDDCDLECPIGKETTEDEGCIRTIGRFALDIIRRQNAELEKKDVEIDILIRKKETLKDEISELRADVERLKAEARKEFAERLKGLLSLNVHISNEDYLDVESDIDNLLAEMESEGK